MLDLIVKGGQVVIPHGVALLDIGILGGTIAALGQPGTLAADARGIIDALGRSCSPGTSSPTPTSSSRCSRSGPGTPT